MTNISSAASCVASYFPAVITVLIAIGGAWVWVLQQRYARRVKRAEDCAAAIWELSGEVGRFRDPSSKGKSEESDKDFNKRKGKLIDNMWSAYRAFNKTFQPIRLIEGLDNLEILSCLNEIQEEGPGNGGGDGRVHPRLSGLIAEIEGILTKELDPPFFTGRPKNT
jgi:hypothetical protein